ncbi:hypothetical protein [Dactylosporangium darangshiense]
MKMPPRVPPPPLKPSEARSLEETGVITKVTTGTDRHALLGLRVLLLTAVPAGIVTMVRVVLHGDRGVTAVVGPLLVLAAGAGAHRMYRNWRANRGKRDQQLMPAAGDVEVRRLRVRTLEGSDSDWMLFGRPRGGDLATGDIAQLRGRRRRDGRAVTRRVTLLATPSGPPVRVVTGRKPLRFLLARFVSQAGYTLAGLLVVWTLLVLLGVFD